MTVYRQDGSLRQRLSSVSIYIVFIYICITAYAVSGGIINSGIYGIADAVGNGGRILPESGKLRNDAEAAFDAERKDEAKQHYEPKGVRENFRRLKAREQPSYCNYRQNYKGRGNTHIDQM